MAATGLAQCRTGITISALQSKFSYDINSSPDPGSSYARSLASHLRSSDPVLRAADMDVEKLCRQTLQFSLAEGRDYTIFHLLWN